MTSLKEKKKYFVKYENLLWVPMVKQSTKVLMKWMLVIVGYRTASTKNPDITGN